MKPILRAGRATLLWPLLTIQLALLLHSASARCDTGTILILATTGTDTNMVSLKESLDSQLVDYNTEASIRVVDSPLLDETSATSAEAILLESQALAVIWISEDTFYLHIKDGERSSFFTRPLPASQDSWELKCDAIASAVRSILSTLLETDVPEIKSVAPPPPPAPEPPPTSPAPVESPPAPPAADANPVRIGVALFYGPCVMSGQNPWINGVAAGIRLQLGTYVTLSLDGGFASKKEAPFTLYRVPLRLGVTGSLTHNKLRFGLSLGLVTDITGVRTGDNEPPGNTGNVYVGGGASLGFGVRVHDHVELALDAGVDIYNAANRYLDAENQTVFRYGPVQGHFLVGMIFWI